MDTVRTIEVIETTLTRRGSGKSERDPLRVVTQYWSKDGALLAEVDPYVGLTCEERIESVARAIYDVMAYDGPDGPFAKPVWVPGGNSLKQDECRCRARAALGLGSL